MLMRRFTILRRWLWIARDRAKTFLETKLSEALSEAETLLRGAEQKLDQS
jgi:hypothetical protein